MHIIDDDQYRIVADQGSPSSYSGKNLRQGFGVDFSNGCLRVIPARTGSRNRRDAAFTMRLEGFGHGDRQTVGMPSGPVQIVQAGGRIEYRRPGITEWYINRPEGLEQGFTIPARPEGDDGPLRIMLSFSTALTVKQTRKGVLLQDGAGRTVMRYDHLLVTDVKGVALPAEMTVTEGRTGDSHIVALVVEDSGAAYPITVDPLLSAGRKRLTADDGMASDGFGQAVALTGDTLVVGAPGADVGGKADQGVVYVFERNRDGTDAWGKVKKLTASDGEAGDFFGSSVAISGDTIVAGAPYVDVGIDSDIGRAYVFSRNTGGADNWGELRMLNPAVPGDVKYLGLSVDIDGPTIVVGAPGTTIASNSYQGTAYVYEQNMGGADMWGLIQWLASSDGDADDSFGQSVAIDGDTIVAGAPGADIGGLQDQGAAYVFHRDEGGADNWGEITKLVASDGGLQEAFGISVDVGKDTIVVGAHLEGTVSFTYEGAAYLFGRNIDGADMWGEIKKIRASDHAADSYFGFSVAIDGDTVLVGAEKTDVDGKADQGAAYLFGRNNGGADNWGQVERIVAADGAVGDYFGRSVALSGDTLAVGASQAAISGNNFQGAVYISPLDSDWWEAVQETAFDGAAGDYFGYSVALSGDTLAVGAYGDDSSRGAVYLFLRNSNGAGGVSADEWGFLKKLLGSAGAAGDSFGFAVALSGDKLIVGAPGDDYVSMNSGSVYIFERNYDGIGGISADYWGEVRHLYATTPQQDANLGYSVAIDNNAAVAGAPGANQALILGGTFGPPNYWYRVKTVTPSDGAAGDLFGFSVSIHGNRVAVGAVNSDVTVGNEGKVYLFERNYDPGDPSTPLINNWGERKQIVVAGGAANDYLGWSVALSGDTLLAGATGVNVGPNANQGAAYVFERNRGGADVWGLVQTLTAAGGATNDNFGWSVALADNIAAVGAPQAQVGGSAGQGAAYLFERNRNSTGSLADNWGEVQELSGSNGAANDQLARALALSDNVLAVGGGLATVGDNAGQGVVYLFRHSSCVGFDPAWIGANPYGSVQEACDVAVDEDTIMLQGGRLEGPVVFNNLGATVTMSGGWNCQVDSRLSSISEIEGSLTIQSGTIVADSVGIR